MAVDLEKIDQVLVNPTTVNLHKNQTIRSDIKVKDRTDLASTNDMGQNFIYANGSSLEQNPRFGKYDEYVNIRELNTIGSMETGISRYTKPLPLKALSMSINSPEVSSSDPFTVTLTPSPNVKNIECNLVLTAPTYMRYFTIEKVNNFEFRVTPNYEELKDLHTLPYGIRLLAQDTDNPLKAYTSTNVSTSGYITINEPKVDPSSSTSQQFHVRYSILDDHSDMTPIATNAVWMGILVDYNIEASDDPNDYNWTKIKGDPGSEGQAGKDGADGVNGESTEVDPTVSVNLSSNVFPVGIDGWATQNKDITYKVRWTNTYSRINTRVSIDGTGIPYAYVANWLDGFTMGKFGLDIWTLFENANHQEISYLAERTKAVDKDIPEVIGKTCIDIPLGTFRTNAYIKEGDSFYARLGFYVPTGNPVPYKVSLIYGYRNTLGYAPKEGRVNIDSYEAGDYRYISIYATWEDSQAGLGGSWMDNNDMYIRFYYNTSTIASNVSIKVFEYMLINMSEILPSGHTLKDYMNNVALMTSDDIKPVMDLLPWFSGEYEAGVDMTWGMARRMFTDHMDVLVDGDLRLDPNYVIGIIIGTDEYSLANPDDITRLMSDYGYNTSTGIMHTNSQLKVSIYYQIPDESFEESWNLSNSTGLICNTSDLPYIIYGLNLSSCTHVSGDTVDIPRVQQELILSGCTGIYGNVTDLPEVRTYLDVEDCTGITGYQDEVWWIKYKPNFSDSNVSDEGGLRPYPYDRPERPISEE